MTTPPTGRPKPRPVSVQFDPAPSPDKASSYPTIQSRKPDDYDIIISWPFTLLVFLWLVGVPAFFLGLFSYHPGSFPDHLRHRILLYSSLYLAATLCATPFLFLAGRRRVQATNAAATSDSPRSPLGQKIPFYTSKHPAVPLIPFSIAALMLLGMASGALPSYSLAVPGVFIIIGIRILIRQRR